MHNIPAEVRATRAAISSKSFKRPRGGLVMGAVCAGLVAGLVLAVAISEPAPASTARDPGKDYPAAACDKTSAMQELMAFADAGDVRMVEVDGVSLPAHTETWSALPSSRREAITAAAACAFAPAN